MDSEWTRFKTSLAKQSPWIEAFVPDLNRRIQAAIVAESSSGSYEPLMIETLMRDLASVLDRSLSLRREARDLEIQAVKAAADYQLFCETFPLDLELELNRLEIERHKIDEEQAKAASAAFDASTDKDPLARGFSITSAGSGQSSANAVKTAERSRELIVKKYDALRRYQEQYHHRHKAEGGSHNFQQRSNNVLRLLGQDLAEARAKASAAFLGIKTLFGKEFALPSEASTDYLTDMVLVVRDAARFLEQEAQSEEAFDLTFPLVQPWLAHTGNAKALAENKALIAALKDPRRPVEFDPSPIFEKFARVRITRVGASIGLLLDIGVNAVTGLPYDPGRSAKLGAYRLKIELHLPKQQLETQTSRILTLGNVGILGTSSPLNVVDGLQVHNTSPKGLWRLYFHPFSVYSTIAQEPVEPSNQAELVSDVKIHVRAIGRRT